MAKIVGNLAPEDDYLHELGPEPNFNESAYYNFFDRTRKLGGWFRIGNRANEGNAERTVCLYLPDGRVLFSFGRPKIANNDAFDAAGLRFEVEEPTQRHRTTFEGTLVELTEPREMADPKAAFERNPKKKVSFDLVHEAVGPLYGSKAEKKADEDHEQSFARAHFEQHMRVTGSLVIDGERIAIDGFGLRDHSWGPRYWQAIHSYEWLTLNFGPDLGAMVSVIQRDAAGKERSAGGVLQRGMEIERLVDAVIEAEYEDNGLYHKQVTARVKTEKGEELTIRGDVTSFIPLRNRRGESVTHIGEGMTEWRLGDRVGYGLSELLRQVK
jgi:hypothetical protein